MSDITFEKKFLQRFGLVSWHLAVVFVNNYSATHTKEGHSWHFCTKVFLLHLSHQITFEKI